MEVSDWQEVSMPPENQQNQIDEAEELRDVDVSIARLFCRSSG
jgi:hypothetical protein